MSKWYDKKNCDFRKLQQERLDKINTHPTKLITQEQKRPTKLECIAELLKSLENVQKRFRE
jgi:hypothetical protein